MVTGVVGLELFQHLGEKRLDESGITWISPTLTAITWLP